MQESEKFEITALINKDGKWAGALPLKYIKTPNQLKATQPVQGGAPDRCPVCDQPHEVFVALRE